MQKGIGTIQILVILALLILGGVIYYSWLTDSLLRRCVIGNPNQSLICYWIWEGEPVRPF